MVLRLLSQLFLDTVLSVLYFPVWWYSVGLVQAGRFCLSLLGDVNYRLAPALWLRNIFVPMFGQRDWQGRIMSFFMRLVNVIARSTVLLIFFVTIFLLFLIWLLIPLVLTILFYHSVRIVFDMGF